MNRNLKWEGNIGGDPHNPFPLKPNGDYEHDTALLRKVAYGCVPMAMLIFLLVVLILALIAGPI